VVTDGHENAAEFIADVIDEVTVPVYAIGMGTAEVIRPDALETLTSASGGYLLLTDALDEENRYRVSKYCLQMLAGVTGGDLILDPSGSIRPGHRVEIPFPVSAAERACQVFVLMPARGAIDLELETPAGERIDAHARRAGVEFRSGKHVSFYRLDLGERWRGDRVGTWLVRLSAAKERFEAYVKAQEERSRARSHAHGIPFQALVCCRSNLSMTARAYAASSTPSRVLLRAVIRDGGLPARPPASVTASVSAPDRTRTEVKLARVGAGVYEHGFVAALPGVYTVLIRASGFTAQGQRFAREQTVTAHLWAGPRAGEAAAARGPVRPR
jgi:hypothetical protein